jgi:hypothetical protein
MDHSGDAVNHFGICLERGLGVKWISILGRNISAGDSGKVNYEL